MGSCRQQALNAPLQTAEILGRNEMSYLYPPFYRRSFDYSHSIDQPAALQEKRVII